LENRNIDKLFDVTKPNQGDQSGLWLLPNDRRAVRQGQFNIFRTVLFLNKPYLMGRVPITQKNSQIYKGVDLSCRHFITSTICHFGNVSFLRLISSTYLCTAWSSTIFRSKTNQLYICTTWSSTICRPTTWFSTSKLCTINTNLSTYVNMWVISSHVRLTHTYPKKK
jgi:hypothetical protein